MQKYEYLIGSWQRGRGLAVANGRIIPETADMSDMLNVMGADGWDLKTVQELTTHLTLIYFQRPLNSTAAKNKK